MCVQALWRGRRALWNINSNTLVAHWLRILNANMAPAVVHHIRAAIGREYAVGMRLPVTRAGKRRKQTNIIPIIRPREALNLGYI